MKCFIFSSLLVVAASATLLEEQTAKFRAFKLEYNKTYKNQVEAATRFAIFQDNLLSVEEHNAKYELGLVSYKKDINQFSDLTLEEFRSFLILHPKSILNATQYVKTGVFIPDSIDWRTQGQVTPVKNQGQCGSCWAFSVTGSTEAAYYRKSGTLVPLSEQQLVDCSTTNGCSGSFVDLALDYVKQYGLESESSYPYNGVEGSCKYDNSKVVTRVSSYVSITEDEASLLEAVGSIGPVSVYMDASDLASYSSGIFTDPFCSSSDLNHAVLIVGYGSENGENFWNVKNSWGASWGDQGYFKIKRGSNECGITEVDIFPVIS